jgi:hypothetical protein
MDEGKALILTKLIPAHTKKLTALWCRKDFMAMSQQFRDIRSRSRNPMDACFWCKYQFKDGDMMALACFDTRGNKVLCQDCAGELLANKPSPGG